MSACKNSQISGDLEAAPILCDPLGETGVNDVMDVPAYASSNVTSRSTHNGGVSIGLSRDHVQYTSLTCTRVRELTSNDDGDDDDAEEGRAEYEVYDSYVRMGLVSNKRKGCSRVNIVICALLVASVLLVAFTLIYVFVILPSVKGKIVFADGKFHQEQMAKLKQLGENVVFTSCGLVRGFPENGAVVFRGIPYAFPPIGSRRWKSPVARSSETNSCWHEVLNASRYGPACVQPQFGDVSKIVGSEDCLYLNVWTPSLRPKELLPVLVWIHSGDLVYGSGHMPGMSPTAEAAVFTNAVFVSFNYRLGAFGFLALDVLREGAERSSGNYGFMDQQLALKWVKDNIGNFGGNQNLVTILGHGSGATSVEALLLSPKSIGLFQRAWLTSPIAILNKTEADACKDNRLFLTRSRCDDADCLRDLSPLQVSMSSPWALEPQWTMDQLFRMPSQGQLRNDLPIFDGHVVHHSAMTNGPQGPTVPVIFGSTYFDLGSLNSVQSLLNLTWAEYDKAVDQYSGILGVKIKELYSHNITVSYSGPAHFPPLPSAQLAHLLGDIKTVCPVKFLADAFYVLFKNSAPLFLYVAEIFPTHNMLTSYDEVSTFLGWDASAFFGNFEGLDFLEGQGDMNFGNVLRQEVMSFTRAGRPDALRWKTLNVSAGIISTEISVAPAPHEYFSRCDVLKELGYFKYFSMV